MSILFMLSVFVIETPQPAPAAAPACQDVGPRTIVTDKRGGVRKLGKEPPAEAYFTVLRNVDGCTRPVKVREDLPPR